MDRVRFFSNQVHADLPLDIKIIPGSFHRNRLYGMRMHSEQTDRQTDTLLYLYRLAEVPDDVCETLCSCPAVHRSLIWYYSPHLILSYPFYISHPSPIGLFSTFGERLWKIFPHCTVSNNLLTSECRTCEFLSTATQTALDRLRYRPATKIAAKWRIDDLDEFQPASPSTS